MPETIEVFSDLILHVPADERDRTRQALAAAVSPPWTFDAERSEQVSRNSIANGPVLAFRRAADDIWPAAGLSLWPHDAGLYVPNVVPAKDGQFTHTQYNGILEEFAESVIRPVARHGGYKIEMTAGRQTMTDWASPEVARKLAVFSSLANKSSGASHPLDQKRWFDFIVSAHRAGADIGVDRLARWLHEVEGWDMDSAHRLAGDFEHSLSLLQFADEH